MPPEPFTVMTGSEYTVPGLVIVLPDVVIVTFCTPARYQNGLQRKFTLKPRCGLPQRIFTDNV